MPGGRKRAGAVWKIGLSARGVWVLFANGLVRPMLPGKLYRLAHAYERFGLTMSMAVAASAIRFPDRIAVVDDRTSMTYWELEDTSNSLAHGLRERSPQNALFKVGVLGRNHIGFVQTCLAAARIGADLVLLNCGLAARQLQEVILEQRIDLIVADEDLLPLLAGLPAGVQVVVGWQQRADEPAGGAGLPTIESMMDGAPPTRLPDPPRGGRTVLLTSGTTGTPKGVLRPDPRTLTALSGILERVPLRIGEAMLLGPPLYHLMGYSFLQLAMMMGNTVVLRRSFDAERTVRDIGEHGAASLIMSALMAQRMVELPEAAVVGRELGSLRIALSGGAPLPSGVARRFTRTFGEVLYNIYGSTEVSWATVATPRDLAAAEATAGTPPPGTTVSVVDELGRPCGPGTVGQVLVGNGMLCDGYTRLGTDNQVQPGLMRTGDLGYIGDRGRLFISGREDDMVLVGSENVFPLELENLLCERDDIREAAAFGVPDVLDGHRLCAYVVPERGASVSPEELRAYVAHNLAEFSVPREIVVVGRLPRNDVGKVLHRELRDDRGRPRRDGSPAVPPTGAPTTPISRPQLANPQ